MRKKREKFGIKLPNGEVKEIAFSSPSSSGLVFGITHSNKHVTLIEDRGALSGHATEQSTDRHSPLGRVRQNEMTGDLWLGVFKPRKLEGDELDQRMIYFTKKWTSIFDIPDEKFIRVTDDKTMSYWDLGAFVDYVYSFAQDLRRSPDEFIGSCPVRQMLSSKKIECGLLEDGKIIVRIDKELFEMDLSLLREALLTQNSSTSGNPLLDVLKKLGFSFFQKDFMERLPELFSEAEAR
jgi:hypothetical protein